MCPKPGREAVGHILRNFPIAMEVKVIDRVLTLEVTELSYWLCV